MKTLSKIIIGINLFLWVLEIGGIQIALIWPNNWRLNDALGIEGIILFLLSLFSIMIVDFIEDKH